MPKPVEELRVRISGNINIPDPAKIESTGDWYILSHLSGSLATFDTEKKRFVPHIAESWTTATDGSHVFKLREGIQFHDGTPITAKDVVWSIKRQLLLKTSTHFPLWDYISGCGALKSLDDECKGIQALSNNELSISLTEATKSFFLQLASPETGIWSAADMDPQTGKLVATKFSGPYWVKEKTETSLNLARNNGSFISQAFPNSPRTIKVKKIPLGELDRALIAGDIDLVVRSYRPFGEVDWRKHGIQVHESSPSTIIYLQATGGLDGRAALKRQFIETLWQNNHDHRLLPADSFLPFSEAYGLKRNEFLAELPEHGSETVRIVSPENFFSPRFLAHLTTTGRAAGINLVFQPVAPAVWLAAFDNPDAKKKYDFILSSYAASERYPAVQLRYITGSLVPPPMDLKKAEAPELTHEQHQMLRDYERWLIRTGQAIPLYFNSTLILSRNALELGVQPTTDAEIELWRIFQM